MIRQLKQMLCFGKMSVHAISILSFFMKKSNICLIVVVVLRFVVVWVFRSTSFFDGKDNAYNCMHEYMISKGLSQLYNNQQISETSHGHILETTSKRSDPNQLHKMRVVVI